MKLSQKYYRGSDFRFYVERRQDNNDRRQDYDCATINNVMVLMSPDGFMDRQIRGRKDRRIKSLIS